MSVVGHYKYLLTIIIRLAVFYPMVLNNILFAKYIFHFGPNLL